MTDAVTDEARSPDGGGGRGEAAPATPSALRIASYNVHACVGRDGRRDAARVAAVVRELDADVIALQEVLSDEAAEGPDQFGYLAGAVGLDAIEGPTLHAEGARYGNAILARLPLLDVARLDLSVSRRESRGAVAVDLAHGGLRLRVVATHLGLVRSERRRQVALLLDWLDALPSPEPPALWALAGDMNEWIPRAWTLRRLDGRFGRAPTVRSFPAARPLLRLDRIWVAPLGALRRLEAHRSARARVASDHLPVVADVELAAGPLPGLESAGDAPDATETPSGGATRAHGLHLSYGDCGGHRHRRKAGERGTPGAPLSEVDVAARQRPPGAQAAAGRRRSRPRGARK